MVGMVGLRKCDLSELYLEMAPRGSRESLCCSCRLEDDDDELDIFFSEREKGREYVLYALVIQCLLTRDLALQE